MNSLVEFWSDCDLRKGPFIHPLDREVLANHPKLVDRKVRTHKSFVRGADFGKFDDRHFHFSLLPVPYIGNLDKARVVILMLNPGLSLADYFTDDDTLHSRDLRRVIRQDFRNIEFPFLSLDPKYCWTGGFVWWEKKLRKVVLQVGEKRRLNYSDALRYVSQRIACIELVPYHSRKFGGQRLLNKLPSEISARQYVANVLVPKARRGEVKVIAARSARAWDLGASCRHVVAYQGGLTRSAPMGPNTPGGKALLRMLIS